MSPVAAVGGPTEQGVANLIHGLAEAIDDADGPRVEALFGNGSFLLGDHPPVVGGAAFRRSIETGMILHEGSPCTQHVITNLVISIDRVASSATSSSRVTVLQAVGADFPLQVILAGRYADRFAWTDQGWAFVERHLRVTLRGDTSRHSSPPGAGS